jgi:hypothetical protein
MRRRSLSETKENRGLVFDGSAWIVVWLTILLIVATGILTAPSAQAQTEPSSELGGDLYPPSEYPTDPASGIVPIGNYDIGCDNGGFLGDVTCMTVGVATNLVFSLGKLLVAGSVWLLSAAIGFTLEAALTDAATSLADLLDARLLGPMRLSHLGLVVSALYMGWQFLRGRIGLGAGEFALSLIILAVLIHISTGSGFGATVNDAVNATSSVSAEIVSLASDTSAEGAADRVSTGLLAGFVRDPYDTINWGRPLNGTVCETARNQALETGPHGSDVQPRQFMSAAGCQAEADFNSTATVGRLVGGFLYLIVAVAALLLLVITALSLVVAKGLVLFLIALLPIALYAGVFPGAGRSLLWHWVASLVRVLALIIVMGIFLAILIVGLTGLLAIPGGMWERFLLVVFFMAVMWVGRRQLVDISSRFADSTLHRLDAARLGGAHGAAWIRPYQAGGLTGLGVTTTLRETSNELPQHYPPVKKPGVGSAAAKAATTWAKKAS